MQLIKNFPTYSDGQLFKALEREFRTGIELKKAQEQERELVAAEQAKLQREKGGNSPLGKCVAVIPEWDYFRMVQKYGHSEVASKPFIQYLQRKFPALAVAKL
jgi:hypothetical protein